MSESYAGKINRKLLKKRRIINRRSGAGGSGFEKCHVRECVLQ